VALDAEHEPAVARLEPLDEVAGRAARPGVGHETRREVGGSTDDLGWFDVDELGAMSIADLVERTIASG